MKRHLIIGNPIEHSLSPKIHNYWLKKNNIYGTYEKKLLKDNQKLKEIFKEFKKDSLFAMNVTVPFKQAVIPYIEKLSPIAEKTNSVNTVYKKDNKIFGDNTDVFGFELSLKDLGFEFKGKTALILGAGGVVPSIIEGLMKLGIKDIFISNRTQNKIKIIKNNFSFIKEIEWGKLIESDILINATSVGLNKSDDLNIDLKGVKPKKLFYDVIYNPSQTKFLESAKNLGHNTLNGKSMFLYQAQKAFQIWHGIVPKIDENILNFFEND